MEADPDYQFLFPNPGENIGTPILGFSDVSFGYKNGPTLFYNLNFGLDLESRAAVVGPNGMLELLLLLSCTRDPLCIACNDHHHHDHIMQVWVRQRFYTC